MRGFRIRVANETSKNVTKGGRKGGRAEGRASSDQRGIQRSSRKGAFPGTRAIARHKERENDIRHKQARRGSAAKALKPERKGSGSWGGGVVAKGEKEQPGNLWSPLPPGTYMSLSEKETQNKEKGRGALKSATNKREDQGRGRSGVRNQGRTN